MREGGVRFWQWSVECGAFDEGRRVRYMRFPMIRAATFFGYWFSYPLPRGGRNARSI